MNTLTIAFFFVLGVAHVYSSVIPLASGAVLAGPLGGAGPTVVAGPAGTVTSSGVGLGGVGVGLGGVGLGWGGWGGVRGWGGAIVTPAVSKTVIAGPAVWNGGLWGKGLW